MNEGASLLNRFKYLLLLSMLTLTFTWMLMLMLTIGIAVHNNAENDTPLCILGLVWVRVPILFGNDLSGSYLPYSKGIMKLDDQNHPKQ